MTMVYVRDGEFPMGSSEFDEDARKDEKPQHSVSLDAFWIDRTEVTNAQYQLCMDAGFCVQPTGWGMSGFNAPEQPVVLVRWTEAQTYGEWAGGRLPTEAEWEYAARGLQGYLFPWGNDFEGSRLNYCDRNCSQANPDQRYDDGCAQLAPVGSYSEWPSWCGVLDMAGNVWEWVADRYAADYYETAPAENPPGPDSGSLRVIRGGSWTDYPAWTRCAIREAIYPSPGRDNVGFRCIVPLQP
jgi:formylglycine-generating enzyme required for sulfatase activity